MVEPRPTQERAGGERGDAVGAWPDTGIFQNALFSAVGQNVTEASKGGGVIGDDDGAVAARPEAVAPVVETTGFLGDVGVDELHKQGELAGAGW